LGRKSFEAFAGFAFVESSPFDPSVAPTGVADPLPPHGTMELPLPDRPQVGVQYVFHHRLPIDHENLAVNEFPAKLQGLLRV